MSTTSGSSNGATTSQSAKSGSGRTFSMPKFGRGNKAASPRTSGSGSERHVRLKLMYVDFWSALKISFLLGLAQAIVTVIATFLLYMVFVQTGVFETANNVAGQVLGGNNFDVQSFASMAQVLSFAGVVGVLNMIVITVLGGVVAVIYNACARIVGGIQVGFVNVPD